MSQQPTRPSLPAGVQISAAVSPEFAAVLTPQALEFVAGLHRTFAARRLQPMIANTAHILGIELLAAAQGIEFLRPLKSSAPIEQAHATLRLQCAAMPTDRLLAPDIAHATTLVQNGALARLLRTLPHLPLLWQPA